LTRYCHRKLIYEPNVLGNLEMRDSVAAVLPDLVFYHAFTGAETYPHRDCLSHPGIRHPYHLYFGNLRMGVKELLYFTRVNVLTAADDHVSRAPRDLYVAVGPHDGEIAGVQPS